MVRHAWFAVLALLTATVGLPTYAADSTSADEQAIVKIEKEWTEASTTKNKAFFEKYLSEDFTFINEDGELAENRSAFIDVIMKLPKFTDEKVTDQKIRVHGSTAVVTGRWSGKAGDVSDAVRFTDTFAKGSDGWKAIASQETSTKDGERPSKPSVSPTNPAGQPAGKRLY